MQVSPSKVASASSSASGEGPGDGGSGGRWHDENALPPASLPRSAAASRLTPRAQLPDRGPRQVPHRGRPCDLVCCVQSKTPLVVRICHSRALIQSAPSPLGTASFVDLMHAWGDTAGAWECLLVHTWRKGSALLKLSCAVSCRCLAAPQAPTVPGQRPHRHRRHKHLLVRVGAECQARAPICGRWHSLRSVADSAGLHRTQSAWAPASLAPSATSAVWVAYWQLQPSWHLQSRHPGCIRWCHC